MKSKRIYNFESFRTLSFSIFTPELCSVSFSLYILRKFEIVLKDYFVCAFEIFVHVIPIFPGQRT